MSSHALFVSQQEIAERLGDDANQATSDELPIIPANWQGLENQERYTTGA